MAVAKKPSRWSGSDQALKAVQVAFDVEEAVLESIRAAAFQNNVSNSDQIRTLLDLPTHSRPKRPRLTVSLTPQDYQLLAQRYGLDAEDRLSIKEKVTQELIDYARGESTST